MAGEVEIELLPLCEDCYGYGQYEDYVGIDRYDNPVTGMVQCSSCEGTGYGNMPNGIEMIFEKAKAKDEVQ